MKISEIQTCALGSQARMSARIFWEDCNRPPQTIFFETEAAQGSCTVSPHAFLVACLLPAWWSGEARVHVDAPVCPELRYGLDAVLRLTHQWWPGRGLVRIEAASFRPGPGSAVGERAAGMFLSGGIDSLASLRLNRLSYPVGHPRSLKIALMVHGVDIGLEQADPQLDLFQRSLAAASRVAKDAGVCLVPIVTNVRTLNEDRKFWGSHFHGALLASVGHAFAHRLSSVTIAAGDNLTMLPWGSHPVLDPLYSSGDLRIFHDGVQLTRLDKTRLIAEWPAALDNLRVCWDSPADSLNCGRCEKCLRTMLHLMVCGKLQGCRAFGGHDVDVSCLKHLRLVSVNPEAYMPLVEPLKEIGRGDLARIVRGMRRKPHPGFLVDARIRQLLFGLDRKILGGRVQALRIAGVPRD